MPGGDDGNRSETGIGPNDGSWGPQNPDAMGNSQYGGTYDAQGRFQVGGPSSSFSAPVDNASFVGPGAGWSFAYEPEGLIDAESRRQSLRDAVESVHGGGLMGSVGRGIGSLFGLTKEMTMMPAGNMGIHTSWNPGALAGAIPGIGGLVAGPLARMAYTASGLPKPGWDTDPLQGKTLTQQVAPSAAIDPVYAGLY